jgi:hypothetical protein
MAKDRCPKCDGKVRYEGGTAVHSITGLKTCAASKAVQSAVKLTVKAIKKGLS